MNHPTRFCLLTALLALGAPACSGEKEAGFAPQTPTVQPTRKADGVVDDRSMCDWRNKNDREASETAGPGSVQPNVRRVFQIVGTGDDRQKVLVCREIDTNFDGIKDVVRKYNEKGESLFEEADSNYDGRVDTWITFAKGRLAEVKLDANFDGNADEWKFYGGGKLTRITRDTNRDGKADIWEIYRDGRLERMGVDVDGDEHVDRWDHDTELRRRLEDAERKKDAEAEEAERKKAAAAKEAAEKDAEGDEESPKGPASKRPRKK